LPRDSRRLEARLAPRRSLNVSALTSFRRWRRHKGVKTTVVSFSSIRLRSVRTNGRVRVALARRRRRCDVGRDRDLEKTPISQTGRVRGSQPKDTTVSCPICTRGCRNRPSKVQNLHRYSSQSFNSNAVSLERALNCRSRTPRHAAPFLRRLDDDDVDETAAVDGFADARLG
jgi:hypothetical protein